MDTHVEVQIGTLSIEKDRMSTKSKKGHYPIWNHYQWRDVYLQEELAFESDMRITV